MKYDPQLHILRTVLNALQEPKRRHEAQSARHNLFAALEAGDNQAAHNWLDALEVALATPPIERLGAVAAERSIRTIRDGLGVRP